MSNNGMSFTKPLVVKHNKKYDAEATATPTANLYMKLEQVSHLCNAVPNKDSEKSSSNRGKRRKLQGDPRETHIKSDTHYSERSIPVTGKYSDGYNSLYENTTSENFHILESTDSKEELQPFLGESDGQRYGQYYPSVGNETKYETQTQELHEAQHSQQLAEQKANYYEKETDIRQKSLDELTEKYLLLENSMKEKYEASNQQLKQQLIQTNNQTAIENLKAEYKTELAEMKNNLDICKKQLNNANTQIQQYGQKCQNYEQKSDEVQSLLEKNRSLEAVISQNQHDLKKVQSEFSNITEENKSLQNQYTAAITELNAAKKMLSEQNNKVKELTSRLSTEMSTKISADERSLENVSVKNRPLNIASEYEMICSNEWHDAKGVVDSKCDQISEEEKIRFLRSIFELSETELTSQLEMKMVQFQNMMIQPFEDLASEESSQAKGMSDQMKVFISDHLRNSADSVNTANIMQEVKNKSANNYQNLPSSIFAEENVAKFIEVCVKLAWKMVLQRPPMYFSQRGLGEAWQGETKQDPFWSSADPNDPQSKVKYYVHPALYHGEAMMVKGRVYLSKT